LAKLNSIDVLAFNISVLVIGTLADPFTVNFTNCILTISALRLNSVEAFFKMNNLAFCTPYRGNTVSFALDIGDAEQDMKSLVKALLEYGKSVKGDQYDMYGGDNYFEPR
jgi:hypothetical protein